MADQSVGSMPSRSKTGVLVIEILAGTLIDPHELARADRFSDEVHGNDLRRVENFSTSRSRHDSLLHMTDPRKYRITPAEKIPILSATIPPKISGVPKSHLKVIPKSHTQRPLWSSSSKRKSHGPIGREIENFFQNVVEGC